MMDLYELHSRPEELYGYNQRYKIPSIALEIIQDDESRTDLLKYIIKSPTEAFYYSKDVIDGRWLEAEPYIMKSPGNAVWYARDIIRGRWEEAEPYIMTDPEWWDTYLGDI